MIIALLILVFLTIIGVSANQTSEFEIQIAGNEKYHKIAFYNADSGLYVSAKVISATVDGGEAPSLSNISYLNTSGAADPGDSTLDDIFYNEIMAFSAHDSANDLKFSLGSHDVSIDVDRTGQKNLTGGGAEFGSGAEGVGVGSAGGVALFFEMDSIGDGPSTAQSNVEAEYRKVLGVAGGV